MADSYSYIAKDASGTPKFGWDGQKWIPIAAPAAPGATKRLITQTLGMPEDIDTSLDTAKKDISSMGDLDTWINAMKQAMSSLNPVGGMKEANATARKRFSQPGIGNKVQGAGEWLESGFPYAGPAAVRSEEQESQGDIAGSFGSAINAALLHRAAPELATRMGTGPLRTGLQFISGVGKDAIEQSRKKFGTDVAKEAGDYRTAVKEAKGGTAEAIAEKQKADIAHSKAESGVAAKDAVSQSSLKGPVYQRVQSIAQAVGDDVTKLDKNIREFQGQKWDQLRESVKDTEVPWPEDTVTKARAQLQTPEDISKFDGIIDKVREEATEAKGVRALSNMEGALASVAKNLLRQGKSVSDVTGFLEAQGLVPKQIDAIKSTIPELAKEPSGDSLPFGEARARFTKLGEKMYGSAEPSGTVYRALKSVHDALDSNIEKSLPSPAAKSFYSKLKADWRQYMQDFYDPNGPFTKVKNAPSNVDRINTLTGKWGKEMMDAMGRYKQFNPNFELPRQLRAINRTIDNLPGSVPKAITEKPNYAAPKEPEVKVFDPVAARRAILQGHPPTSVTPSLFWKYTMLRNIMKKLANMPSVQDFLSQNPK